jgi:hypothetical protein
MPFSEPQGQETALLFYTGNQHENYHPFFDHFFLLRKQ